MRTPLIDRRFIARPYIDGQTTGRLCQFFIIGTVINSNNETCLLTCAVSLSCATWLMYTQFFFWSSPQPGYKFLCMYKTDIFYSTFAYCVYICGVIIHYCTYIANMYCPNIDLYFVHSSVSHLTQELPQLVVMSN